MICSLLFSGKVSAYELTDFCDYTDPCLSTEMIDEWFEKYNTEILGYDSYFISLYQTQSGISTFNYLVAMLYNKSKFPNSALGIQLRSDGRYQTILRNYTSVHYSNTGLNVISGLINPSNKNMSTSAHFNSVIIGNSIDSKIDVVAYYTNNDVVDKDGNVVLYRNDIEVPKEDPNVVNNRAFLVKLTNFYKSLFSIISNIASTIVITPILAIPFGFCILAIIVGVFYKLFLRR